MKAGCGQDLEKNTAGYNAQFTIMCRKNMALNVFMFKQTPMIYILTKNINTEHLKNILDTEEGKKNPK